MKLYDICMEIAQIENGLAEGEIRFSYDKLMSAMKPGHPADILDDIFGDVGNAVYLKKEVPKEKVKELLKKLKEFKKCFKVKELAKPISDLDAYLKEIAISVENN